VFDLATSTEREENAWDRAAMWVYKQLNPRTGKLWPKLLTEARDLIVESREQEQRATP
jgi:hypothetical protein